MSDNGTVTISDSGSVAKLQKTMADMVFKLGKGLKETVFVGAWYVARAAGAATKVAPKYRTIKKNPLARTDARLGNWMVQVWKNGKLLKEVGVRAATRDEVKRRKIARIMWRGLAKSVWGWMLKGLGKPKGRTYLPETGNAFELVKKLGGLNPEIRLMSRIRYARDAFKTKGKATESNILRRAASGMQKSIEYKLRHIKV